MKSLFPLVNPSTNPPIHKVLHKMATTSPSPETYVILGAGVVGLTTALELRARYPTSTIHIAAKYMPGDKSIEYTSPWAGANWSSVATDNGRQENWDAVSYHRFTYLAENVKEAGVQKMELRAFYDRPLEEAGILSQGTGKVWYEGLVGGLRGIEEEELPEGSVFGFDMNSFVIEVPVYLSW